MVSIYLIEDDPDDILLMEEALQKSSFKYSLDISSHGDMVFPHLKTCKRLPDVIILDLNLPKKDGREILKSLCESEYKNIPVMILTTSSAVSDIEYCMNTGAKSYQIKPTTMEEYYKIVDEIFFIASKKVNGVATEIKSFGTKK